MTDCQTTCPYCGVGCGVTASVERGDVIAVMGDGNHPANAGRLCVKGTALAETLGNEGRLLHPTLAGDAITWDSALDLVAKKLQETRRLHGPESVAFYLSGQLLTEDYYVANKLMKGFLGSANVDTNSRLCMSSAVAAYKRAFGEDIVPCSYEDLETCDLLVMTGSNAAWTHPVVYQRIVAAKKENPEKRVVVIDTRKTATCDVADLHLQIKPGSDAFLFGGLLKYLDEQDLLNQHYIDSYTEGFAESLEAAASLDRDTVCRATGLDSETLESFYQWFGATDNTVTLYSQGINQSATGTDKCNAIINCHLATGRIGRPGAGPFSITGQPNAMGGREVGGLANQLAAHMDFTPTAVNRVERFWNAADMASGAGLKAVDMFAAAAEGKIKFIWIMATNPAVSLPDTDAVRTALQNCDFVVVSDCTADTDTAQLADLVLPAAAWGEKDGTVTNSERVISRQRKFAQAAGESRPDWWMITEVARRMGFGDSFEYDGPADIFREHAALSAFENHGERAFNIGALSSLSDDDYDGLAPTRWPKALTSQTEPLADGRYFTPSGRAQFIAVNAEAPKDASSLILNTGRFRDQWHTMTRTGRVPRLSRHRDFFSVSVSPKYAQSRNLRDGDLVTVKNALGRIAAIVTLDAGLPDDQVFAPIHWSDQFASAGTVSALIPAITDPNSGQPQSKFAGVELARMETASWGLLFSRDELIPTELDYWSRIPTEGGFVYLLADCSTPEVVAGKLARQLPGDNTQAISYIDALKQDVREVHLENGVARHALFLNPDRDQLPGQAWILNLGSAPLPSTPHSLLAGCDPHGVDTGPMVCSCWEVGETEIRNAVAQGADSVETLGQRLRCGTQCGSCIPELKQIILQSQKDCAA
ncbi:MAG: molybdopterin-dependent oxidoreductase [Halioglobus sp.]